MLVADILRVKGRKVVTVHPQESLRSVVALFLEHRIGAVVILSPTGWVEGILSERDIVRGVAQHGVAALDKTAGETMTRRVVTCREGDNVHHLMESMTEGRFRHVPVVEKGTLVGIVSIGDVVKERLHAYEAEAQAMRDYITTA